MKKEAVGEHCRAVVLAQANKTTIWDIFSRTNDHLGVVRWFGRWRGYAFFPADGTVFEQKCLRAIAEFCEAKTLAHKGA